MIYSSLAFAKLVFTRTHSSIMYTSMHSTSGLIIFGSFKDEGNSKQRYYFSLTKRGKSSLSYLPILPFFLPAIIFLAFEFIKLFLLFFFFAFYLLSVTSDL